jgi:serine/threonine protein kinase
MEFLDGGEVCNRINYSSMISENDIRNMFKSFITALAGIHSRGYIHNDLKVQNLMLASKDNDSEVRIIDLGYMRYLPAGQKAVKGERLRGTPGYIAPETLTDHEYSYKTGTTLLVPAQWPSLTSFSQTCGRRDASSTLC